MKVFSSWSGGKDSCLSCYKAMLEGHDVAYFFTMFATDGSHTRSHRLSKELLMAQSQAIGVPVYHRCASRNTYEKEFKRALAFFKEKGIQGGVFGDLYLEEHRIWLERVCANTEINPLLPLWGIDGKDLLLQFMQAGFEAVVIAVKDDSLGMNWLGRKINQEFISEMQKEGVDICGEKGEYHTLVIDGPVFKKKIAIGDTRVVRRQGVSLLEILNFELEQKGNSE